MVAPRLITETAPCTPTIPPPTAATIESADLLAVAVTLTSRPALTVTPSPMAAAVVLRTVVTSIDAPTPARAPAETAPSFASVVTASLAFTWTSWVVVVNAASWLIAVVPPLRSSISAWVVFFTVLTVTAPPAPR